MNIITTSGLPSSSVSRNIKIQSKQKKAQCVPYFFSTIKNDKKSVKNK